MASGNIASASLNMNSNSITNIANLNEKITSVSVLSNIASINYTSGGVYYISSATANFTVNLTIVGTANTTFIITLLIPGTYYCNVLSINGTPTTIQYAGGSSNISTTSSLTLHQPIMMIYTASASAPAVTMASVTCYY
jgi:hypothetical protein